MYAQADMCLMDGSSPKRMSMYLYKRSNVSISLAWYLRPVSIEASRPQKASTEKGLPIILMISPKKLPVLRS